MPAQPEVELAAAVAVVVAVAQLAKKLVDESRRGKTHA
jgi:hypothetical protein